MEFTMNAISDVLKDKLENLVSYLCQVTKGFENVAEDIECSNLKTAVFALSIEAKQYAEEISDQLKELNITIPVTSDDELWKKIESDIHKQASFSKGGEILALCNNCEIYFNKFYEDVLLDYLPLKNFKDIITFQLYATKVSFMKIRLLNKLRFSNTVATA
jgi:SepF-like predicted cell division protein (DUF552 family)